jgi:DNA-binding response OmpR family regulator
MYDVLLLDDDDQLRSLVSEILTDEGWDVSQARSTSEAQEKLEISGCKLMVADRSLGQDAESPDGFVFAGSALRRFPDLAVIYVTGEIERLPQLDLSERERTLPKPFAPSELLELVHEMLG